MEIRRQETQVFGCIIDETHLDEIDSLLSKVVADVGNDSNAKVSEYEVNYKKEGALVRPENISELKRLLGKDPREWGSVTIVHNDRDIAFRLVFSQNGIIETRGFGPSPQYDFAILSVENVLKAAQEDYNWLIRQMVFKSTIRKAAALIFGLASLFLVSCLALYIYASIVGVDIDSKVIPKRGDAVKMVADALNSKDPNKKLDALLAYDLGDFTNVSDLLLTFKKILIVLSALATFSGAIIIIRRALAKLHPRIFLNIGRYQRTLERMRSKRQIWIVAILIGFAVNIAAGFLVALLV